LLHALIVFACSKARCCCCVAVPFVVAALLFAVPLAAAVPVAVPFPVGGLLPLLLRQQQQYNQEAQPQPKIPRACRLAP
jgi:hypothetical protein